MIRRLLLAVAAATLALGWAGAATAAQATTYSACNGVWVIVDYGSLGDGVKTSCATSFSTGTAALRSAGFALTLDNGFVTRIGTKPTSPNIQKAYWSYWQAKRKSDGSYSGWSYSNAGSNAYHPTKGNAEGWHYVNLSDTASGPSATPPKNPAVAAATTKATPTATATATATAKSTSKATSKATSSKATSTPSATEATTSSATPSSTPSASASPSAVPTPAVVAAPEATTDSGTGTAGSPLPLIITGVVVVAGGASAGAWWLWRGRKR